MKDIRISIRLTEEEHIKLKILSAKKRISIQNMLHDFIIKELQKDGDNNEKN